MIYDEDEKNTSLDSDSKNKDNLVDANSQFVSVDLSQDNNSEINNDETPLENENVELKQADSLDGIYNEKASTSKALDTSSFKPLIQIKEDDSISSLINENREKYKKDYKKKNIITKTLNITLAVLLLLSLVILVLSNIQVSGSKLIPYAWVPITVISIAGAFAIGLAIFLYFYNKKFQNKTHDFFIFYQNAVSSYSLSSLNTSEVKIAPENQLNDELMIQAHYFSTIISIKSRGLVVGKMDDEDFSYGEIACIIPYKNKVEANANPLTIYDLQTSEEIPYKPEVYKDEPEVKKKGLLSQNLDQSMGVLGRMLALKDSVESNKSIIVCFKGDENTTFMPDYVSNYKAYKDSRLKESVVLFLASDDAKAFFDDEGINLLNQINVDETFTSGFISINSYGSKIVMNLSDEIMALPIDTNPNQQAFDSLKDNLKKMTDFVKYVASKKDAN